MHCLDETHDAGQAIAFPLPSHYHQNMKKRLPASLAAVIAAFPAMVYLLLPPRVMAQAPAPAAAFAIRLELDAVSPAGSLWLKLSGENLGREPVTVIRPRRHMLDITGGWGGWTLVVTGPGGEYHPPFFAEGPFQPPMANDVIELLPGESFSVRVNVGRWIAGGEIDREGSRPLAMTGGSYGLQAAYATPAFPVMHLESELEAAKKRPLTLIAGLRSNTVTARVREDAVEPQITALREEDGLARQDAVQALARIGSAAVRPLITALGDGSPTVRLHAAQALGLIADTRTVPPLIAALKDPRPEVRTQVAAALGRMKDGRVFQPLSGSLRGDGDGAVRLQAARALGELRDARAVQPLIAVLGDDDPDIRSAAVQALGGIGRPASDALQAALGDKDARRRQYAAQALGEIRDPRAIAPLIAIMKDQEPYVRFHAYQALGRIGEPAVDPLITALRDGHAWVRLNAVHALGEIQNARAVGPLIAALQDKTGKEDLNSLLFFRLQAAESLGKMGAPAVAPLVALFQESRDRYVYFFAANALRQIKDPRSVEPLIAALASQDDNRRYVAAQSFSDILDPRAVEPLIAVLKNDNRGMRMAAAEALGRMRDARAVGPLSKALQGADPNYREIIVRALRSIGTESALEAAGKIREP